MNKLGGNKLDALHLFLSNKHGKIRQWQRDTEKITKRENEWRSQKELRQGRHKLHGF